MQTVSSALPPLPTRFELASRQEHLLRHALRGIVADGKPLDCCEILTAREELLPLCFEITRLLDLPSTFDPGVPLHYSKAARTVVCWLRWLSEDFAGRHLIRMMYDGIPAPQDMHHDGERGGRLQMASLLRRAGIGTGRERLLAAVDARIAEMSTAPAGTDGRAVRQARANRAWLARMLVATPEISEEGLLSLHALADGALVLVGGLCRDAYPGEGLALARISELMTAVRAEPDENIAARDAAWRVIALIRASHFPMVLQAPGSEAMPTVAPLQGHLHVTCGTPSGRAVGIFMGADAVDAVTDILPAEPPLSLAEWWTLQCLRQDSAQVRRALHDWSSLHREGTRAEEARSTDVFTAWDGNVGPGMIARDAADFSDEALRRFDCCPYAFFLEHLLDVKEPAPWRNPVGKAAAPSPARTAGSTDSGADTPDLPVLRARLAEALAAGSFPHEGSGASCTSCLFRDICTAGTTADVPELQYLFEALRVLTDPENPLPVVAFLRGPLCGADDRALLAYHQAGGLFAFNARAIPDSDRRIADGLQFIKDTVRLVRSNPPGMVVASMIDRLALHAAIACSPRGWVGSAALQALLARVYALSMSGFSLPEIVDEIEGWVLGEEYLSGLNRSDSSETIVVAVAAAASSQTSAGAGTYDPQALDPAAAAQEIHAQRERASRPTEGG